MPDISGFTKFVHETDIRHSKHIIAELLEVLIDANTTNLILSEIEGDALLFYQKESSLSIDRWIEQAKEMYQAFHLHLKKYELQRICPCGACKTANDLKLKIVVRFGDFEELKVKDIKKLHGESVILAHRLLKNNIEVPEYVLLSGINEEFDIHEELEISKGKSKYESIGEVEYDYFPIELWQPTIELPQQQELGLPGEPVIKNEIRIDAPPEMVMRYIADFSYRMLWADGVDRYEYDEGIVNRQGNYHQCIIGNIALDVESIIRPSRNKELVYGERFDKTPLFKELMIFYSLYPSDSGGTLIKLEFYNSLKSWWVIFVHFIWKAKVKKDSAKSLLKLKKLVESREN